MDRIILYVKLCMVHFYRFYDNNHTFHDIIYKYIYTNDICPGKEVVNKNLPLDGNYRCLLLSFFALSEFSIYAIMNMQYSFQNTF